MTSQRKRKKAAASRGLNTAELDLLELTGELLDAVKWLQVLGYANQYLVHEKLDVPEEERDKIVEAAARTVERDKRFHEWRDRLARIKQETLRIHPEMEQELRRREAARKAAAPRGGRRGSAGDGPVAGEAAADA